MAARYLVLRKLMDGQIIPIMNCEDLPQAKRIVDSLREHWPAEYFIRGPHGFVGNDESTAAV
jgi:hypothetical protein